MLPYISEHLAAAYKQAEDVATVLRTMTGVRLVLSSI